MYFMLSRLVCVGTVPLSSKERENCKVVENDIKVLRSRKLLTRMTYLCVRWTT